MTSTFSPAALFYTSFSHHQQRFVPSTAPKHLQIFRLRRKTNHSGVTAYLVFSPPVDKSVPVIFLGFPNPEKFWRGYILSKICRKSGAAVIEGGRLFLTPWQCFFLLFHVPKDFSAKKIRRRTRAPSSYARTIQKILKTVHKFVLELTHECY